MNETYTEINGLKVVRNDRVSGMADLVRLENYSEDNVPAVDDGIGIVHFMENSVGRVEEWGAIDLVQGDVTDGAEAANWVFRQMIGGVESYMLALNAAGFSLNPIGGYNAQEGMNNRYRLTWTAGQRGKPGINGDIQDAAEATRMVADPDFEILGTNSTSALSTFAAEGGITITTDVLAADQMILAPHLDANQSGWTQVTWGTDQSTRWECRLRTGASIADAIIWAGLKLTNTAVTITDANQVFFRYEEGVVTGNWQAIDSIANVDNAVDSSVTVAINTDYHLVIEIDSARLARFYIDGVLISTSAALTTAVDLIPYIGVEVQAGGVAGAKAVTVRGQAISRSFA